MTPYIKTLIFRHFFKCLKKIAWYTLLEPMPGVQNIWRSASGLRNILGASARGTKHDWFTKKYSNQVCSINNGLPLKWIANWIPAKCKNISLFAYGKLFFHKTEKERMKGPLFYCLKLIVLQH